MDVSYCSDGFLIDPMLKEAIKSFKEECHKTEDDGVIMIVGDTGVGKSGLGLHIAEEWNPNPDIQFVCLTHESHKKGALAVAELYEKGIPDRWLMYDELELTPGRTMSKKNQDTLIFYSTNRGAGVLHIWCWPSVEQIQRYFIENRINAILYCLKKEDRGRIYYFFSKEALKSIFELEGKLSNRILEAYVSLSDFQGRHKKYEGKLSALYIPRKKEGVLDSFHRYGGEGKKDKVLDPEELIGGNRVANALNIPRGRANSALERMDDVGFYKTRTIEGIRIKRKDVGKVTEFLQMP